MLKKIGLSFICFIITGVGLYPQESLRVFSTALQEDRIIQVELPDGYETSGKIYPALFVLDGEYIFEYAKGTVNFLTNDFGFIPEMIIIGIPNTDRNRDLFVDLTPDGAFHNFLGFLERELIPFVDEHFRTNGFRIIYGWSSGSGIANYLMVKNPSLFEAYILAGSGIGPKTTSFIKNHLNPKNYANKFLFGSAEGNTIRAQGLLNHENIMKQLNPVGLNWRFRIYENENHVGAMSKGLYDGIQFVFEKFQIPDSISSSGHRSITTYYEDLSNVYGFKVEISVGAINELSAAYLEKEDYESALMLLKEGISRHAETASLHGSLAEVYLAQNQHKKALDEIRIAINESKDSIEKIKYRALLAKHLEFDSEKN